MVTRIRRAVLAAASAVAAFAAVAPSAHAGLLSLAPGPCGQRETQPFTPWGDLNEYVQVPGGTFEPGTPISFTFAPADGSGDWSIDDVYLDPYARA